MSFIPAIDGPRLRGLARQVIVFGGVGVTATLVHLCVALSIRRYWRLDPLEANMIAFLCAVLVSYAGHALLTFRVQLARRKQFVRFVVISIGGLGLNQLVIYLIVDRMGMAFWQGLLVVVFTVPPLTFIASRVWAFEDRQRGASDQIPNGDR